MARALGEVESELADTSDDDVGHDGDDGDEGADLDAYFTEFEERQPALAEHIALVLGKPLDETALALGYFLTLAVWLAFDRNFEGRLEVVGADAVAAVEQSLALDEELRRLDPAEAVDSDDVVAMEQPHVLAFVHEHLDAALEVHAGEIDVDDVHAIYRVVLVEVLALSYAVRPPEHYILPKTEFTA